MLHELTYSLIKQIDDFVTKLDDVVWEYPGVSLNGRSKPFATVRSMETENENMSKERTYYEETYHFQIGLFTDTHAQMARLSGDMKNALRQPEMKLYDTSDSEPKESGVFYADLRAETPIIPEDIEDETRRHRTYYDVEIIINQNITEERY